MTSSSTESQRLRHMLTGPVRRQQTVVIFGDDRAERARLLEEARHVARSQGMRVIELIGVETRRRDSGWILRQFLRQLDETISRPEPRGAPEGSTAEVPTAEASTGEVARRLVEWAAPDGLLITVDDGQWVDVESRLFARVTLSMTTRAPIVFISTRGRSDEVGVEPDEATDIFLDSPIDAASGRERSAENESLSERARRALALLRSAGRPDASLIVAGGLMDTSAVEELEEAGVIRIEGDEVTDVAPALSSGRLVDERELQGELSRLLAGHPGPAAYHHGLALTAPDEEQSAALELHARAVLAQRGALEAVSYLRLAARLTASAENAARLLLLAAEVAMVPVRADIVLEIAHECLAMGSSPSQRYAALRLRGWSLGELGDDTAAVRDLRDAFDGLREADPVGAWECLGMWATIVHIFGRPPARDGLREAVRALVPATSRDLLTASPVRELRLWAEAAADPFSDRAERLHRLRSIDSHAAPLGVRAQLAAVACVLDQTRMAADLLHRVERDFDDAGAGGANGSVYTAEAYVNTDLGAFDEVDRVTELALEFGAKNGLARVVADAHVRKALMHALAGASAAALEHAAVAAESSSRAGLGVEVRVRNARAFAYLANDEPERALNEMSAIFDADGRPLHHYVSYMVLGDLALVADRSGRGDEMRPRIHAALGLLPTPWPSRVEQQAHTAAILLDDPIDLDGVEEFVASGVGLAWPREHAFLLLALGEKYRQRRSPVRARLHLSAARDLFEGMNAEPWRQRAADSLRGPALRSGAQVDAAEVLTEQQFTVIRLAASGLSNKEIATRLYLSVPTVRSHLYRAFPKLGITDRGQLAQLLGMRQVSVGGRS